MNTREADIAVIGGGPAGIAAATRAAESGARVLLLDDNPGPPGGQIWRGIDKGPARAWRARLALAKAQYLHGCTVVGRLPSGELLVDGPEPFRVNARTVILATGLASSSCRSPDGPCPVSAVWERCRPSRRPATTSAARRS